MAKFEKYYKFGHISFISGPISMFLGAFWWVNPHTMPPSNSHRMADKKPVLTGPNRSLNHKKTTVDRSSLVQSSFLQIANLSRLVLVSVYACQGQKTGPDWTFKHYGRTTMAIHTTMATHRLKHEVTWSAFLSMFWNLNGWRCGQNCLREMEFAVNVEEYMESWKDGICPECQGGHILLEESVNGGVLWHRPYNNVIKIYMADFAYKIMQGIGDSALVNCRRISEAHGQKGVVTAILWMSSGCICVWKKESVISIVAQIFPLAQLARMSSICGMGKLSRTILLFSWQ